MSKKEKFALYLPPEKKAELERRCHEDGSRSATAFVENAVDFYLGYLSAGGADLFLSKALQSYLDGRLGMLEKRLSAMLFKLAVENDMTMHIMADSFQLDEDYLRRMRSRSVKNVKQTNGQLSFERIARSAVWEDEWQD